ncbi:MAG TPA: 30S ribosomal protein S20 [Candidatus Wildermuthbacteria bacterium]|nr:30S ribosomal protein S20 [Candidatus Wildermuthbacteria bacterium]
MKHKKRCSLHFSLSVLHFLRMPITKSAKKALRQSAKGRVRNLKRKRDYRNLVKQAEGFIAKKNLEEAQRLFPQLSRALDKAVRGGVLEPNTAARKKARFAKLIQKSAAGKTSAIPTA